MGAALTSLPSRLLLAVLVMLVVGAAAYVLSEQQGRRALIERSNHRLDLLAAEIDGVIGSGSNLPSAIVLNGSVLELLRSPPATQGTVRPVANRFLENLNNHLGALTSFVIGRDGRVLASSDWMLSENLLGSDFSYQPFFRMAMNGSRYGYYASDAVRNEPGFYFSQPILDERQAWHIVGVAVVKVNLADLQRRWLSHETPVLVVDSSEVVILSTVPEWRYTVLTPGRLDDARLSRTFDGRTLRPFPFPLALAEVINSNGRRLQLPPFKSASRHQDAGADFLAIGRTLYGAGWQIVVFAEYASVRRQALTVGALAAVACGALVLLLLFLAQRRRIDRLRREAQRLLEAANHDLEAKVAARTSDLTAVNHRLRREVNERIRAEATLRAAQDELIQAAKLAVLGQLAAGITHELSQPLGAVRTLAANAVAFMQRGDLATATSNLEIVARQIDQMGRIIGPLKTFARKSPARREPVDLAHAVGAALLLFGKALEKNAVRLENRCQAGAAVALCDANRLEQVLVNLIGNAIDALREQPRRVLQIDCEVQRYPADDGAAAPPRDICRLLVSDSGPGIPAAALARLFEPFYTTKPAGVGLGLGLAISRDIVRDFGGELLAENSANPDLGAVFIIELPAAAAIGDPGEK